MRTCRRGVKRSRKCRECRYGRKSMNEIYIKSSYESELEILVAYARKKAHDSRLCQRIRQRSPLKESHNVDKVNFATVMN